MDTASDLIHRHGQHPMEMGMTNPSVALFYENKDSSKGRSEAFQFLRMKQLHSNILYFLWFYII